MPEHGDYDKIHYNTKEMIIGKILVVLFFLSFLFMIVGPVIHTKITGDENGIHRND